MHFQREFCHMYDVEIQIDNLLQNDFTISLHLKVSILEGIRLGMMFEFKSLFSL